MQANYVIRPMRREELDIAVNWAALEGWNPGLGDADAFYAADPGGFWIGVLDGEPIASISAVAYDDDFAFVGFYIVRPEFRGRGFGLAIWQRALARLHGRNIGLDGVPAQQANYERAGFRLAYRHVRYEGRTGPGEHAAHIVPLSDDDWPELLAYDRLHFGSDRPDFLRRWLALPESIALGYRRGDDLAGYGVIRRCRSGYKLGPLFASGDDKAQDLFTALASEVPAGEPLFLDVPEANPGAVDLARRHGMKPVFETARMYTGAPPAIPVANVYGVTTLELG